MSCGHYSFLIETIGGAAMRIDKTMLLKLQPIFRDMHPYLQRTVKTVAGEEI
jgi:hypothetical protein